MKLTIAIAMLGLSAMSAPAIAQAALPPGNATAAPADATPPDPASLALANQILTIAYPPEKRAQLMSTIMDSVIKQTRENAESKMAVGDKDFQALLDRSMQRMFDEMKVAVNASLPDYFASMARAYARDFSRDDLNAILAFAKTPGGQHFFERSPLILKDPDVQAANRRMSAQLLTKLPEIQGETMRDIEDYVAKKQKQAAPAAPTPTA